MDLIADAKGAFQLQAYAETRIDGVQLVELKRHGDDGGALTELARLTAGTPEAFPDFTLRQINYSEVEPAVIKAFHVHQRQTDIWYVPPSDRMLVVLIDVRAASKTKETRARLVMGNGTSRLLRIPPGVAHGVRNIGASTGRIIYFVDVQFSPDPASCDEGRLPWDYRGADVWEIARG